MTRTRPEALVVMDRRSCEAHLDPTRWGRLEQLVSLGTPVWSEELDSDAVRARLAEVEVLVTSWGAPQLTADRLAAAPRLRAVFHAAGSVKALVSGTLWDRGIRVTSSVDANAVPVAEYAFAAIVLAGKKAPFIAQAERAGTSLPAVAAGGYGDLSNYGRTIGIIGFSRIGRRVVRLLQALEGVSVLVSDPHADPAEVAAAGGRLVDLAELLPRAEVLSLHAPSLPSTRHLIGAAELALLPDHATVLNTARGALVDTEALARECGSGRLFAILDVTDPEPLPDDSPLRAMPTVMLTPHVAGSLGTEIHRLTDHLLLELNRWIDGEPLAAEITATMLATEA